MKDLKNLLIAALIFLGIIAVIVILVMNNIATQKKFLQMETNFEQMFKSNQTLTMSLKDVRELYPAIDSMIKKNKIKNIQTIEQTEYYFHTDSVFVKLIRDTIYLNDSVFLFDTVVNKCLTLSGKVRTKSGQEQIDFNTVEYNDLITIFEHYSRKRLFGWKWMPKWGKKVPEISVYSECTDSLRVKKIIID